MLTKGLVSALDDDASGQLEEAELRGHRKADPGSHRLYKPVGAAMEVEAKERLWEDIYVLAVRQPDVLGHGVPEKVVERDVRGAEDTGLVCKRDSVPGPSGPTRQCLPQKYGQRGRGYRG